MLTLATILLILAAAVGAIMLAMRVREELPPIRLALLHGALAAAGLLVLAILVIDGGEGILLTAALAAFFITALGGSTLLASHVTRGSFPLVGAAAHAGTALLAFVILIAFLVR
jgi:hypothetical protein